MREPTQQKEKRENFQGRANSLCWNACAKTKVQGATDFYNQQKNQVGHDDHEETAAHGTYMGLKHDSKKDQTW